MKMESYNIREQLAATHVTRWHIVDTVKNQSVAEHQWSVCMISIDLALSMGVDDAVLLDVMMYALTHDLEEIETGDIPSPYKEKLRANGDLSLESQRGVGIPIAGAARAPDVGAPVARSGVSIPISAVVRVADLIETHNWIRQYAIGRGKWDVINDCYDRMMKYISETPSPLQEAAHHTLQKLK